MKTSSAFTVQCYMTVQQSYVLDLHFSLFQMEMSAAAGGLETSGHRQCSGTGKRRRWGGLRQQWKLLGLFEIDQQHEFYTLTCMMKEGLAAATQNTIDNEPTVSTGQQRQQGCDILLSAFLNVSMLAVMSLQ